MGRLLQTARFDFMLLQKALLEVKETLINSIFVIPAKAGIQLNQATGHRLSPV